MHEMSGYHGHLNVPPNEKVDPVRVKVFLHGRVSANQSGFAVIHASDGIQAQRMPSELSSPSVASRQQAQGRLLAVWHTRGVVAAEEKRLWRSKKARRVEEVSFPALGGPGLFSAMFYAERQGTRPVSGLGRRVQVHKTAKIPGRRAWVGQAHAPDPSRCTLTSPWPTQGWFEMKKDWICQLIRPLWLGLVVLYGEALHLNYRQETALYLISNISWCLHQRACDLYLSQCRSPVRQAW
jgi:hypothetical protein